MIGRFRFRCLLVGFFPSSQPKTKPNLNRFFFFFLFKILVKKRSWHCQRRRHYSAHHSRNRRNATETRRTNHHNNTHTHPRALERDVRIDTFLNLPVECCFSDTFFGFFSNWVSYRRAALEFCTQRQQTPAGVLLRQTPWGVPPPLVCTGRFKYGVAPQQHSFNPLV